MDICICISKYWHVASFLTGADSSKKSSQAKKKKKGERFLLAEGWVWQLYFLTLLISLKSGEGGGCWCYVPKINIFLKGLVLHFIIICLEQYVVLLYRSIALKAKLTYYVLFFVWVFRCLLLLCMCVWTHVKKRYVVTSIYNSILVHPFDQVHKIKFMNIF